jgi:hypothetical protein
MDSSTSVLFRDGRLKYLDDQVWSSIWLYHATGNEDYLKTAKFLSEKEAMKRQLFVLTPSSKNAGNKILLALVFTHQYKKILILLS